MPVSSSAALDGISASAVDPACSTGSDSLSGLAPVRVNPVARCVCHPAHDASAGTCLEGVDSLGVFCTCASMSLRVAPQHTRELRCVASVVVLFHNSLLVDGITCLIRGCRMLTAVQWRYQAMAQPQVSFSQRVYETAQARPKHCAYLQGGALGSQLGGAGAGHVQRVVLYLFGWQHQANLD